MRDERAGGHPRRARARAGAGGRAALIPDRPTAHGVPARSWRERGPLALAAVLVVAGMVVIVGSLWLLPRGPGPELATGSAGASIAATPSPSPTAATPSVQPSGTPTETPAPTPRVIAEPGIDLTWRAVATLPGTAAGSSSQTVLASALAAAPGGGYLAVGEIVDGYQAETGPTGPVHPAIWLSADGIAWRLGDASGLKSAVPSGVASDGHRVVIVARSAGSPVVLASTDLRAWTPITPPGSRVVSVVAGGPGFVALGERLASHRFAIWTTTDGAVWKLAWESTVASGEELDALAVRPDGRMLAGGLLLRPGGGVRASAVASADGLTWRRVPAANLPATMGFDAIGPGADGAWYASGFDDAADGIGAWRSSDGISWRSTSFGPGQLTELPGDTGSATVVFGYDRATFVLAFTSCCGDPPQRTLVSRDGSSWQRADRAPAMTSVHLRAVRVEPGRVLAVGDLGRGSGVWAATPAPTNGVELPTELRPMTESDVCSGSAEVRVRLAADRSGAVVRLHLFRTDSGEEFGPIVWPYGWSAAPGTSVEVRDRSGATVAREGDELALSGGTVIAGSYHLCRVDGQLVTTR
ncbi:MAG TPA: hypothetical protein VKU35_01265 [Candidatus Limnocylindria bacterium]|nr:hypothetical protein [Candidatus Limnocylindria bacterium]